MTNVNQISEPYLTHHSVDDQPVISFDDAIAIFQKYFPVTDPAILNNRLVYNKFSGLAFVNAYRKIAHRIITEYNLPLEATALERYKSGTAFQTYLTICYKPTAL